MEKGERENQRVFVTNHQGPWIIGYKFVFLIFLSL